jgi:hypothetical protein
MKKLLLFVPLLVLLLCAQPLLAQPIATEHESKVEPQTKKEKAEAASKLAIEKVLKYAQNRNYDGLARITVYAGREPNRTMKTKINTLDPHEKLENENTCNYMHHILEKSVIWNATNFRMVNAMNDKFFYWDVEFTDDKMKTRVFEVLLVELNNEFLFARFEKKGVVKTVTQ